MNDLRIEYSPFGVILIPTILILGGLVGPIVLDIMSIDAINRGKTAAIYFFIGATFIALILLPFIYLSIKCFINYLKNQPAILLTKDYYVDNIENVKLSWTDIKNIWTITFRSSFLKVTVVDNAIVYRQATNPIWKFVFWNNAWNGGILSINLTFLKGKNQDVVNTIKDYQQKIIKAQV